MNRRHLLSSGSLAITAGMAGCVGNLASRPSNDADAVHMESDVWGEFEGPRPNTRAFDEEATALEKTVGPAADRFEVFVRETDFRESYLVLVQGVGVGAGTRLTLRGTERVDETLEVTVDTWPPEDGETRPGTMFLHSLATRQSRGDRAIPETVEATVIRPEDRSVVDEIDERV